jgi:hypothetical protein
LGHIQVDRPAPLVRLPQAVLVALGLLALSLAPPSRGLGEEPPKDLAPPVQDGPFLRPASGGAAEPVWGVKGGISVGLWPTSGPRGLIRIYTPYLGQPRLRTLNFIAVEPIVGDARGLSELERSDLDETAGKAMWTGDELEDDPKPRPPWRPAAGRIGKIGDVPSLTFFLSVERFENGAQPIVQVILRGDRPHEVGFRVFTSPGGAPMRACVLTATMGNYARLRSLWLADRVLDARRLWGDSQPDRWGFLPARARRVDAMLVVDGEAIVAATTDEPDPEGAVYADEVPPWWRYRGRTATQYWRASAREDLVVRVNGRRTYWGTDAAISGGLAYENFELETPFKAGQEFRFGVTPDGPEALGFDPAPRPK